MMTLILWVLTILSVIWTWRLINFGVRTAERIARASEITAFNVEDIYESLSPEAKQRAIEVMAARKAKDEEARKRVERPGATNTIGLVMASIMLTIPVVTFILWAVTHN